MSTARLLTAEDKEFVDTLTRVGLSLLLLGQAAAGASDTDIWGHMAIGLDMWRDHGFLWVDPYSFTHDQPWINHEWLWDLGIAGVYRAGGLPAVVGVRAVLIALVLWIVDRATKNAPGWVRILTLFLVAMACVGQWRSTRPQMATLALYAILLANIEASWLPLLFLAWANLHGGWLVGLAAVVAYAITHRSRRSVITAVGCAVATLVNPYGLHLWAALAEAMRRGWADVTEWQPIWTLTAGMEPLWLWLLLVGAVMASWRRVSRDPWAWSWTILTWFAAANSRRLIALAALTSALLLVPRWQPHAARPPIIWTAARRCVMAIAVVGCVAVAALFIQPTLACFPPLPQWNAPEPDAVAFLRTANAKRVVVHFDYGGYAIFHLRDRLQVSIDNRRETVYSDMAIKAGDRFAAGLDPEYPDRIEADAIWWPTANNSVLLQQEQRGWVRRFEGPRTVILLRSGGPLVHGRATVGTPCFPNP